MARRIVKTADHRTAIQLVLPATSANLGPAFDAAALALRLFLKVRASIAQETSIAAAGRDAEICGQPEGHLILQTYHQVMQEQGKRANPLALQIDNQIPIGKGCGSSAAARIAGIVLAVRFGRLQWSPERIVGEASWREHHPDNAAACWAGGLVVARMSGEREAQVARIRPKGEWPLLLAVPPEALPTQQARAVLPRQYSRNDAVINIQNSMLLLAAFTQGRPDLLTGALQDRIHQPYRAPLCPLLPCLEELAGNGGVLGVALSGAGPSVMIFVDPLAPVAAVRKRVARHLAKASLPAELIVTSISQRGAAITGLGRTAGAKS
jgi:homoserine kinase